MSLRYSFFAIVPDGIIEIPQGSNLSWLTLFYALPRELVENIHPPCHCREISMNCLTTPTVWK